MDRLIADLPNLGKVTADWLREVGIERESELRALGAPAAYRRLKHWGGAQVSRNALWALHAALSGERWNELDAQTKARLLAEAGEA